MIVRKDNGICHSFVTSLNNVANFVIGCGIVRRAVYRYYIYQCLSVFLRHLPAFGNLLTQQLTKRDHQTPWAI